MVMKNIIVFFICISSVFGQVFKISSNNERSFTVNKYDKIIYARNEFSNKIYEYDLKNNLSQESVFPSLPTFANKSRKAAYYKDDALYLYDLDYNNTTFLGTATGPYINFISFSPNDTHLLLQHNDTLICFYFTDSRIKKSKIGFTSSQSVPKWTSDSTMLYTTSSQDILFHYNPDLQKRDTLINLGPTHSFLGFDYNKQINALAYSWEYLMNKKITLLDMNTKNENIIVDFARDFSEYSTSTPFGLMYLKWSPDYKKLCFFGYWFTNSISSIFTYYLDSSKTKLNTKWDDYGKKGGLEWFNQDTIIFVNSSLFGIYGFTIPDVYTSVKEESNSSYSNCITLKNYPNPFNSSTILEINVNESVEAELIIYNLLGQLVYRKTIGWIIPGKYSYYWNGIDQTGHTLSSGMYIALIQFNNSKGKRNLLSQKLQLIK